METTSTQQLFNDPEYRAVPASAGKRFANYLIDLAVFYILVMAVGFLLAVSNPEMIDAYAEYDSVGAEWLDRLLGLMLYGLYMFLQETVFSGKSLGKFLTGTRAVNTDGTNITAKTALLRGLSRMVPFEVFSALGTPTLPWHDQWSKTYVIDEKASNRPEDA